MNFIIAFDFYFLGIRYTVYLSSIAFRKESLGVF